LKIRLAALVSGLALAACEGPAPTAQPEAAPPEGTLAERADELPGDPICRLSTTAGTQLPAQPERRFIGAASSRAGSALAAGDLDGDGVQELLIGAPGLAAGSTVRGSVHVVPVMATGTPNISVDTTRFDGEAVGNRLGAAVALGNYTGGTSRDLVLGAPAYTLPSTGAGAAYTVDATQILGGVRALNASSPRFRGVAANDQAGSAVAVADVTGPDGAGADLIVTAPFNDPLASPTDVGAIYVFPGPVTTGAALSLGTAPLRIIGNGQAGIRAGTSIAVADVNGDGRSDLAVGVPFFDGPPAATDSGAVYVFFGDANLTGTKNLSEANLVLTSALAGELAGSAVAGAGDLDGDGREELLIGAPGQGTAAGRTYLVYGGATGAVALGTQPVFTGISGDRAGTAVAGPGDINGDGWRDLLIGAPNHSSGAGAVYVVYGGATRFPASATSLTTVPRYAGATASQAGSALVGLGDVDGDGSADFAIGAPGTSSNAGAVHLVLGFGPRGWYPDADGDRYGVSTGAKRDCGEPTGPWASRDGDCNDSDATVNPGATEVCDGKDNNCDGPRDDDPGSGVVDPKTWYEDADGDRHVYLSTGQQRCTAPASNYIEESQLLGFECESGLNTPSDNDASVHEGAAEVCDGKDNNCDGNVDDDQSRWPTWYPDGDEDGFGRNASPQRACTAPTGHVSSNTDCDDTDNRTYPGATETCDNKDNNCNGTVDEGVKTTYYLDADGDGFGVPGSTTQACTRPTGYSNVSTDCNDSTGNGPRMYPGNTEVCDGLDNDCDFDTDEGVKTAYYLDADRDTQGSPYTSILACVSPTGYVTNNTDCNDSNAAVRTGATEVCDDVDNDCDFQVDEGVKQTFYADVDGDGVGTTNASYRINACTAPPGYVTVGTDCNDADSSIRPGAAEVCDGIDNDCDGLRDEGVPTSSWYPDNDRDGFGAQGSSPVVSCGTPGANYVSNNTDCDDTTNRVSPVQVEVCEAAGQPQVDNNCSGGVDDAINASTWYRDVDADGYGNESLSLLRCAQPAGYVATGRDCNDSAANVNPGRSELCEPGSVQVDNDCDGDANDVDPSIEVSQGGAPLWYGDGDRDGHAGSTFQLRWCTNPSDLNDANGRPLVRGAYLAGPPNDCNDSLGSAFRVETWYEDTDNDGCGNPNRSVSSCGRPGCNVSYVLTSRAGCI
jgi:hypothetical protein